MQVIPSLVQVQTAFAILSDDATIAILSIMAFAVIIPAAVNISILFLN